MLRNFSLFSIFAAILLLPTELIAGGPPSLCLPIDGVTPESAKACADLLTTKLEIKIWPHERAVKIQQYSNQWYLTFFMEKDVKLSDVEAALKGSDFSVPRERLRLFGHVILEIDTHDSSSEDLLAGLAALKNVSVAGSPEEKDCLLVTVDMPYPDGDQGRDRKSAGWDSFRRNDFSADSDRSPMTADQLPSVGDFREVVSKHDASLKDIHWSVRYVCRSLGGVTEPRLRDQEVRHGNSTEAALPVGKWIVEFTNGVTEVCVVGNAGTAVLDEPRRRSRGNVAVAGSSIVISFNDDRVERWTWIGKRLVVEHWFPGSQFPSATPVLGIADCTP